MRIIEFTITDDSDGRTIRDYLRDFGVSSALLTKLKKAENGITLNGEFARSIDRLSTGDTLAIRLESSGKMPVPLENKDVAPVYNDEDVIIFNKPSGMPVHESRNHLGDTLANIAACYINDSSFRAVYRLDRDTSGLVVIAKNELAASKLAGRVGKDYYAVCQGVFTGSGTVDLPIRRERESIIKRGVYDDGERAVTHWEALKTAGGRTLLKLNLETGRTHQIRVHFAHLGTPLLGDSLYGGDCSEIDRQALHCKTVRFIHPVTQQPLEFDTELPEDMKGLI